MDHILLRLPMLIRIMSPFVSFCSHHMPVTLKMSTAKRRLQYATWVGNTTALIIIVDNDIYLRQSPSDEEDVRLTLTGEPFLVYNGIPDWLYQGELMDKLPGTLQSPFNMHFMWLTQRAKSSKWINSNYFFRHGEK